MYPNEDHYKRSRNGGSCYRSMLAYALFVLVSFYCVANFFLIFLFVCFNNVINIMSEDKDRNHPEDLIVPYDGCSD